MLLLVIDVLRSIDPALKTHPFVAWKAARQKAERGHTLLADALLNSSLSRSPLRVLVWWSLRPSGAVPFLTISSYRRRGQFGPVMTKLCAASSALVLLKATVNGCFQTTSRRRGRCEDQPRERTGGATGRRSVAFPRARPGQNRLCDSDTIAQNIAVCQHKLLCLSLSPPLDLQLLERLGQAIGLHGLVRDPGPPSVACPLLARSDVETERTSSQAQQQAAAVETTCKMNRDCNVPTPTRCSSEEFLGGHRFLPESIADWPKKHKFAALAPKRNVPLPEYASCNDLRIYLEDLWDPTLRLGPPGLVLTVGGGLTTCHATIIECLG